MMDDLISRQIVLDELVRKRVTLRAIKMRSEEALVTDLMRTIYGLPAANRWIPCNERLPQEDIPVLVTDCGGGQHVWNITRSSVEYLDGLCWEDDYGYYQDLDDAVAWMPLPAPGTV